METQDRLGTIRQTTLEDLKELEAIHCFLNLNDSAGLDMLQLLRKEILTTPSQGDLETFSSNIRDQIAKTRKHFDVHGPREILVKYLDHAMSVTPPGDVFFIRKHSLSQLTSAYDSFVNLPLHAWIAIDVHGTNDLKPPKFLYRLLEEAQYRDMCALFNLAATTEADSGQNDQAILAKSATALHRATIDAACHFIEAYINGIAHAHLLKYDGKLDPKTKAALTEWDFSQNRPNYQSLRDKILHYPRIIRGSNRPILDEKNCDEFRLFFKATKPIRDAVAHSSPAFDQRSGSPEKELRFFAAKLRHATAAVDNAIALAQKIETLLKGDLKEAQWLVSRPAPDKLFPEDQFE